MPKTMIRLGEVLVEYGYITEAQVEQALAYQKQHKDKRLGEALIEMGYITEAQMLSALAQKLSMRFIPLDTYPIQADCVAKIPKALAQRYNLIAVGTRGNHLVVAMNDPLNFYALEDIKLVTGMLVQVVLVMAAILVVVLEKWSVLQLVENPVFIQPVTAVRLWISELQAGRQAREFLVPVKVCAKTTAVAVVAVIM